MSKYKDLTNYNRLVYSLIKPHTVVLDVGCAYGVLGRKLVSEKGCVLYGIDFDQDSLEYSQKKQGYKKVWQMNLNQNLNKLRKDLGQIKFDAIVFADVLEHLVEPNKTLKIFDSLLKKKGNVIISLPNINFLLYRLKHLFGKFDYEKFGALDETHLRFFTLSNYKTQLPYLKKYSVRLYGYSPVTNKYFLLRILAKVFPSLFALQIVLFCEK